MSNHFGNLIVSDKLIRNYKDSLGMKEKEKKLKKKKERKRKANF